MRIQSEQWVKYAVVGVLFVCVNFSTERAWAKKPQCVLLAEKVCLSVGILSFVCRAHQEAAKDPKVSQVVCRKSLSRWGVWLGHMKKLEVRVQGYEKQGRGFGSVGEKKVSLFKQQQVMMLKRLLRGEQVQAQAAARACSRMAKQVCWDLGKTSYYCGMFRRLSQEPTVKGKCCQVLLTKWKEQRKFYEAQEKRMQLILQKGKQNPAFMEKIRLIQNKGYQQTLRFLQCRG